MIKRLALLLGSLLFVTGLSFGQRYDNIAINLTGHAIPHATVAVCTQPATISTTPCSTLATLYIDDTFGTTTSNPITADAQGNYHFYAKGAVTVQIYGGDSPYTIVTPFVMVDQAGAPAINLPWTWTGTQTFGTTSTTTETVTTSNITTANIGTANTTTENVTNLNATSAVTGSETVTTLLAKSSNNTLKCDQFTGSTAGRQIQACILALGTARIADATGITNTTIDVDMFLGASTGEKLILGPLATFTSNARQIIPAGWEVMGGGQGTKITFSAPPTWSSATGYVKGQQVTATVTAGSHPVVEEEQSASCTSGNSTPSWTFDAASVTDNTCSWLAVDATNFGFIGVGNAADTWHYATTGAAPVKNVSLHDMTLDFGSTASWNGLVPRNVSNSNFYNLWLQNANASNDSSLDLRDAVANNVHDIFVTNGQAGQGHSMGGGTNTNVGQCTNCGLFEENIFRGNHVLAAATSTGDGIDISGINGTSATCRNNIISGNSVDTTPSVGIFVETCDHTVVSNNTTTNTGSSGVYINNSSGGGGICGGGACGAMGRYNSITGNTIDTVALNTNSAGITLVLSNFNNVSDNTIQNIQAQGILLLDVSKSTVSGNHIADVSQAGSGLYNGVLIKSDTASAAIENTTNGNAIASGASDFMEYGIAYLCAGSCVGAFGNSSTANAITGGHDTSTGAYTAVGTSGVAVTCTGGGCSNPTGEYTLDRYCSFANSCASYALANN